MPEKTQDNSIIRKIIRFYVEGFKSMTVGKYLWALIIVKLAILFLVIKLFFFPDFLNSNFDTDEERSSYVRENLVNHEQ